MTEFIGYETTHLYVAIKSAVSIEILRRRILLLLLLLVVVVVVVVVIFTIITDATICTQWLRCCAKNRKVVGSIPDGVIGIFH